MDTETGLYYLMSRYYDPVTCRFVNADGYFQTGQGFLDKNMSAYCMNNPIMFFDPMGTAPCLVRCFAGPYCGKCNPAPFAMKPTQIVATNKKNTKPINPGGNSNTSVGGKSSNIIKTDSTSNHIWTGPVHTYQSTTSTSTVSSTSNSYNLTFHHKKINTSVHVVSMQWNKDNTDFQLSAGTNGTSLNYYYLSEGLKQGWSSSWNGYSTTFSWDTITSENGVTITASQNIEVNYWVAGGYVAAGYLLGVGGIMFFESAIQAIA